MGIVGGLDVHRRQITFDYVNERTGEVRRGRAPACRELLRWWLASEVTERPARFAVEACTGWRFVVEELTAAGIEVHLAEPADTAAARGPKRRARPIGLMRVIYGNCWRGAGYQNRGFLRIR
jgi:transposase